MQLIRRAPLLQAPFDCILGGVNQPALHKPALERLIFDFRSSQLRSLQLQHYQPELIPATVE